ncbi:hypothetical protein Bbelb_316550 [Branchiostoma belcheri]|nr:hypothetical protein Bbelb_316550 [Branchiostoma belcheri]
MSTKYITATGANRGKYVAVLSCLPRFDVNLDSDGPRSPTPLAEDVSQVSRLRCISSQMVLIHNAKIPESKVKNITFQRVHRLGRTKVGDQVRPRPAIAKTGKPYVLQLRT